MDAYLEKLLNDAGITHTEEERQRSIFFLQAVISAGKLLNLTGAKSYQELAVKHLLDSLYLRENYDLREKVILDLGTGAGFPGVPLKIFSKDTVFYYLDSSRRKINFLKYTLGSMDLKEVYFINGRAEDYGDAPRYCSYFDLVTIRAVAETDKLVKLAMPFLKNNGILALYKGPKGAEELLRAKEVIALSGGEAEDVFHYELPGGDKRAIYLIRKTLNSDS